MSFGLFGPGLEYSPVAESFEIGGRVRPVAEILLTNDWQLDEEGLAGAEEKVLSGATSACEDRPQAAEPSLSGLSLTDTGSG